MVDAAPLSWSLARRVSRSRGIRGGMDGEVDRAQHMAERLGLATRDQHRGWRVADDLLGDRPEQHAANAERPCGASTTRSKVGSRRSVSTICSQGAPVESWVFTRGKPSSVTSRSATASPRSASSTNCWTTSGIVGTRWTARAGAHTRRGRARALRSPPGPGAPPCAWPLATPPRNRSDTRSSGSCPPWLHRALHAGQRLAMSRDSATPRPASSKADVRSSLSATRGDVRDG